MGKTRKEQLELFGCVIRAIESVAEAPLTRSQRNIRLDFLKQPNPIYLLTMSGKPFDEVELRLATVEKVRLDKSNVDTLLETIRRQTHTPAGNTLSKTSSNWAELTVEELHEIGQENSVILLTQSHAEHIKPVDGGKFVSVSDHNNQVFTLVEGTYRCLIFKRKI